MKLINAIKNKVTLEILHVKILVEVRQLGYDPRLLTPRSIEQEEFKY